MNINFLICKRFLGGTKGRLFRESWNVHMNAYYSFPYAVFLDNYSHHESCITLDLVRDRYFNHFDTYLIEVLDFMKKGCNTC